MKTETMTTDYRAAAAAGLSKKASCAFSIHAGTATITAEHDGVWVTAIVDAAPEAADGTEGSLGAAQPLPGDRAGFAVFAGRDIGRIIRGVLPAADTETSRYALGGTLVEIAEGGTIPVVATDGRRMHVGYLQPSGIEGAAAPIVPATQWVAFDKAIRAVLRVGGLRGQRVTAAIDRGVFTITVSIHAATGGHVVSLRWASAAADGLITVEAVALAIAGRFPRWRDIQADVTGQPVAVYAADVADAMADHAAGFKAARRAAREAWKAEQAEAKRTRRYVSREFRFGRGVVIGPGGIRGVATEWASPVVASRVDVKLDRDYLAAAAAGVAEWSPEAVVWSTDAQSVVSIAAGDCGPRFEALIMPMA